MSQLLDKETLKKMIRENVKTLYRKTLEAASAEEVYQNWHAFISCVTTFVES